MRSLLFNFFNVLLFSFFTITTFAQDDDGPISGLGTISNDGNEFYAPEEFCLNDNNELIVKVNVLLGNLQINGVYPNEYGVIPPGYHDMYVEFTIGGVIYEPVPVGNFDLVVVESTGYPAFSYIAESPAVDFSDECQDSDDGYVYTSVSFRLVTPGDDGWKTYPACLYDDTMFNCYVYPYAPWCETPVYFELGAPTPDEPATTCYDGWFSGGYSAKMKCDCDDDTPWDPKGDVPMDTGGDYFGGGDTKTSKRVVTDSEIIAYPNPMSDVLQIESYNESIKKIEIYNSRGDLLVNNTYSQDNIQNININTSDLVEGLYLARIVTESGFRVIKVLK